MEREPSHSRKAVKHRRSVVLPAPFGPIIEVNSPFSIVKESP
jgi:hypothetical protein